MTGLTLLGDVNRARLAVVETRGSDESATGLLDAESALERFDTAHGYSPPKRVEPWEPRDLRAS